jgi:hypothetical protein
LFLAGAGNVLHHHDRINAEQQRKRRRQPTECLSIDLISSWRAHIGDPLNPMPGTANAG